MSDPAAWLQASRPLAQINIYVPLWLGQALAFHATGQFSLHTLYASHMLGALLLLVIVFTNDVADAETDALNRTHNEFSGGSRVLPEGRLTPAALRSAARLVAWLLAFASLYAVVGLGRPWTPALLAAAGALVWAYHAPPLRLSYRGGGEWLQGLGTGALLPALGFYLQTGTLAGFPLRALVPLVLLGIVGNIVTSLPDYPSDRASDKRTYAVRRGQWAARRHSLEFLALAAALGGWVVPLSGPWIALLAAPALILAATCVSLLGSADAEQRDECRSFVQRAGAAVHVQSVAWSLALIILALVR